MKSQSQRLVAYLRAVWWYVLPGLSAIVLFLLEFTNRLYTSPRAIDIDSAVFLYSGWRMTVGELVYVHFWDIKPPLIHYLMAVLTFLTGSDPMLTYVVSTGVGAAAFVGSILLVAILVKQQTENQLAACAGAFSILAFSTTFQQAAAGIRPKYLFCFFGLFALYLYIDNQYLWAGVSAALAGASYQFGGIIALVLLAGLFRNQRGFLYASIGLLGTVLVLSAPFLLTGELWTMIRQVVVLPLLDNHDANVTAIDRYTRITEMLPYGGLFAVIALVGGLAEFRNDRAVFWFPVVFSSFIISALFIDLNGPPDLLPLSIFGGIGVGYTIAKVDQLEFETDYGMIRGDHVLVSFLLLAIFATLPALFPITRPPSGRETEMAELYFNQVELNRCHVRMSTVERWWVSVNDLHTNRRKCHYSINRMIDFIFN